MVGVFANDDGRRSNLSAGAVDVADGEPRHDPGIPGESIRSAFQAMRSATDCEAPRQLLSSPAIGNDHDTHGRRWSRGRGGDSAWRRVPPRPQPDRGNGEEVDGHDLAQVIVCSSKAALTCRI